MQMFLGQKDPMQSWPVQNGQCKVETNRQNSVCTIPISAVCAIMNALFLHPCIMR